MGEVVVTEVKAERKRQLDEAVRHELGATCAGAESLCQGEMNDVYRLQVDASAIVFKAFRRQDGRRIGPRLRAAEPLLRAHGVPAPRLIATRDEPCAAFPRGYAIFEHVEGTGGLELAGSEPDAVALVEKIGRSLRRLHAIELPSCGEIGDGRPSARLSELIDERLVAGAKGVLALDALGRDDLGRVITSVRAAKALWACFPPCLVHFDPNPDNCVVPSDGELCLIDWDNVRCEAWITDYAHLMFGEHFLARWGEPCPARRDRMSAAFFRGHATPDIAACDVRRAADALNLARGLHALVDYTRQRDAMKAERCRTAVREILYAA